MNIDYYDCGRVYILKLGDRYIELSPKEVINLSEVVSTLKYIVSVKEK